MRLLTDAGIVAGAFDAEDLFELDLDLIQSTTRDLFNKIKFIVGEALQLPDPTSSPRISQPASSNYALPAEEDSDTSSEPRRMSLGPSGASMLEIRAKSQRQEARKRVQQQDLATEKQDPTPLSWNLARSITSKARSTPDWTHLSLPQTPSSTPGQTATARSSDTSSGSLQRYFEAAMSRFLAEQGMATAKPATREAGHPGSQDVEMESVGEVDLADLYEEFDPDDLDFPSPPPAAVVATVGGDEGSSMIHRDRISAISDLKELAGRNQDEDRARAWIGKVKQKALMRDQASDAEKCVTFADLLAGPARNGHRQLARSTQNKWPDLLRSFETQYCGLGVSVARQYYHVRRRSDESPLEYLHRLNVAGLRAHLKIKDGGSKVLREHVDHFIETLGDPELADRLTLLRLLDAEELEEVLRALDRAKQRHKKAVAGSNKFRQRSRAPMAPARCAQKIQVANSGTESGLEESDSDPDGYPRIYLATGVDRASKGVDDQKRAEPSQRDRRLVDPAAGDRGAYRSRDHQDAADPVRCSQFGSRKHTESGCWRHLICEKCGKKGHPGDHCFYVCRGCRELHEADKCPMEEFYNQIHRWYDPIKQGGLLPEVAEKMLNLDARRVGIRISSLHPTDEFARSDVSTPLNLHLGEARGFWKQRDQDRWFEPAKGEITSKPPKIRKIAEVRRSGVMGVPDLLPGESRGYWKYHAPGKWFRQAKVGGKIDIDKATMLLDSDAEVSILDTAFARKVGCHIDRSQIQDCVGIGENVYTTNGRARIKITLAGCRVYCLDIWVGDLAGQDAILGMDFMVPAGVRLDLADGTMSFPDEMRIQLSGRRPL
ncbi:hypothetical protein PC123_g19065 [Phytophthora cactorum]|nr:hypothetical protein PC123_g19065 [Phytophthora cactorum]